MKAHTWDSVSGEWTFMCDIAEPTSPKIVEATLQARALSISEGEDWDSDVTFRKVGDRYVRFGWFGGRGQFFVEVVAEDDFQPRLISTDGPVGAAADALGVSWLDIVGGHDKFMADMTEIWGEPRKFMPPDKKPLYTWKHRVNMIIGGEVKLVSVEIGYHTAGRTCLSPGWFIHATMNPEEFGGSSNGPSIYDGAKVLEIFKGLPKPDDVVRMVVEWNNRQTRDPLFKMYLTPEDHRRITAREIKRLLETIPPEERAEILAEAT